MRLAFALVLALSITGCAHVQSGLGTGLAYICDVTSLEVSGRAGGIGVGVGYDFCELLGSEPPAGE